MSSNSKKKNRTMSSMEQPSSTPPDRRTVHRRPRSTSHPILSKTDSHHSSPYLPVLAIPIEFTDGESLTTHSKKLRPWRYLFFGGRSCATRGSFLRRRSNLLQGIAVLVVLSRIMIHFCMMNQDIIRVDGRVLDVPPSIPTPLLRNNNDHYFHLHSNATRSNDEPMKSNFDPWTLEDPSADDVTVKHRRLERKQRTRPPADQQVSVASSMQIAKLWSDATIAIDSENAHDWKLLCEAAGLSSTSRVVITNALSSSAGPALALLMSQQCDVLHIAGVDPIVPNLRKVRMAAMNVYRMLYRSIDDFQLVVPTATAGFAHRDEAKELQWLVQFQPTHIIHMEGAAADDESAAVWGDFMSHKSQRLFRLQNSMLSLQQLLRFCQSRTNTQTPISLLHVTSTATALITNSTHSTATSRIHRTLSDSFSVFTASAVHLQHLELPTIFGPTVSTPSNSLSTTRSLFVDDAVAAILIALQKRPGLHRMTVTTTSRSVSTTVVTHDTIVMTTGDEANIDTFRDVQTTAYKLDQEHPYGVAKGQYAVYAPDTNAAASNYRQTYGIHKTRFPCASSCNGPTSPVCEASVFDEITPISLAATTKCKYVVYLVDFSVSLKELYQPKQTGKVLCRVAFVSGKSPVVRDAITDRMTTDNLQQVNSWAASEITKMGALQRYNGKLKSNGWTLVWLAKNDATTLTDAENALVVIEPGRFFAPTVVKAMLTQAAMFAEPPDFALLRIMERQDRDALPRHVRKERRSGIALSRFVEYPAENARAVALFVAAPPLEYQPKNIAEYAKLADKDSLVSIPRRQLTFYKKVAHFVQTDLYRPEDENRKTIYVTFPFQWVSMAVVVHDLHMEAARTLRCSWYDEHLYWGHSNRGAEELSLAYVIGKRRIEGSLGPNMEDDATWIPILNKDDHQRVVTNQGAEAFLRIMK